MSTLAGALLAGAPTAFALAKHAPRRTARVLELGCGPTETTRDLGRLVGPKGSVVAFECCTPRLPPRAPRAASSTAENVSFVMGHVESCLFDGTFDLVFARFGTMVLDSPEAALRNIRTALRPGGLLLGIAWRALADNPWAAIPEEIGLRHLPPARGESRARWAAPFAMADPDRVRAILEGAGFTEVALEAVDAPMLVGADLDDAVDAQLATGPAGELVRAAGDLGEQRRGVIIAELRAALEAYATPRGVVMGASSWTVTATNPPPT